MEDNFISVSSGKGHKFINIFCILLLIVIYLVTVLFNGLSGSGNSDLFNSNIGNLSDKYELDISPAGFTFSIWSIIYTGIALTFIFYGFTILTKRKPGNGYRYLNPVIASPAYCIVYCINMIFNNGWIFSWDRELLVVASYVLFSIAATNALAMTLLIRNIERDNHLLMKEQPKTYWTYIVLAFNGHGIYCTWTVIASLLNFTHCLHYRDGLAMQTSVLVSLSMLLIILVGWAMLEMIWLDAYARFLITPYLVVIWALSGILAKKFNDPVVSDVTKGYVLALMIIAISLMIVKISILTFRQIRRSFVKYQTSKRPRKASLGAVN